MSKPKGRTPKLDPAASKAICKAVAAGVPVRYAAGRVGVTDRAVRMWKARGRQEKAGPYVSFLSALKKAEASAVAVRVRRIERAGRSGGKVTERTTTTSPDGTVTVKVVEKELPPQWTADAWYLERRHPGDFAGNRREMAEMKAHLAALLKAVESGKLQVADKPGEAGAGGTGG